MKPVHHTGNTYPGHPEDRVRVKWAGEGLGWSKDEFLARQLVWKRRGWAHDIAAYVVVGEGAR